MDKLSQTNPSTEKHYVGAVYRLPFSEDTDFDQWCFEVDMWKLVTVLKPEKQGRASGVS